jgi:transposase-like protein
MSLHRAGMCVSVRSVHLDEVWVGVEDGPKRTLTRVPTWEIMDTSERAVVNREPQRRRWPVGEKCRIVEQTLKPGASVARVALEHGVNANQVFSWRWQYRQGLLSQRDTELVECCGKGRAIPFTDIGG